MNDGDWVAFLDDDTHLPPDYEDVVTDAMNANPSIEGFVFQQNDKRGLLRMDVDPQNQCSFIFDLQEDPRLNRQLGCDTGQMLFKKSLIGARRWRTQTAADHEFYKDVALTNKEKVKWVRRVASIHNALR
jgi:hypothetical protein